MKAAHAVDTRMRTVTFEVRTERPLPMGEQVFIAGASPMLGDWRPDGLPLTRMSDLLWAGAAMLPAHEDIEYKITRGTWDTERLDAAGALPGNFVLRSNGDAVMRHSVTGWRDGA